MRLGKLFFVVVLLLFFYSCRENEELYDTLSSNERQDFDKFKNGVLRIKVNNSFCSVLEENTSKDGGVSIETISSLKNLKIKSLKRTFAPAGKFEKRTRESGLHLWYDVYYDGNTVKSAEFVRNIENVDGVEIVELQPKIARIGSTQTFPLNGMQMQSNTNAPFNDPQLGNQWHYCNNGTMSGSVSGCDINVFPLWEQSIVGNPDVIVSVVDGGIDILHEDLSQNIWKNMAEINGVSGSDDDGNGYVDDKYGYNFVANNGNVTADDHGTHVAGTIGAVNNNFKGVCGVAGGDYISGIEGVRLMSCEIFEGDDGADGTVAIKYGADNGAVISQNSWGYVDINYVPAYAREAIDYFIQYAGKDENGNQVGPMNGGIVIFASGNDDSDFGSPGSYDPVFTVSAVAHDYVRAYYSNYGSWVDIAAPGGDVYKNALIASTLPNNQYGYMQGTSMACPHVSGVAALTVGFAGGPGFTPDDLKERMLLAARNINSYNPNFQNKLGGLIDAYEQVLYDNVAPVILQDIGNILYDISLVGTEVSLDLEDYIYDADGEQLEYDLTFTNSTVVSSRIEGNTLYITPLKAGRTNFIIKATDRYGLNVSTSAIIVLRDETVLVDIYPNPVKNNLFFQTGSQCNANVIITGVSGAKVFEGNVVASTFNPGQIKLNSIDAGVYKVTVTIGDKEQNSTIVKY